MKWKKIIRFYPMTFRNRWWALWHLVILGRGLTFSYWVSGDKAGDAKLTIPYFKEAK